jgi:hypothetical protein
MEQFRQILPDGVVDIDMKQKRCTSLLYIVLRRKHTKKVDILDEVIP